ncbi:hypothetical protein [Nostoc sp. TCL26-01]|uniref:hypothetical protein n=1 Tax=Nostoc sp. TCL26-01 TaxID=2576904 RepID=UPI0021192444|nr:hypothetical protein [Nostoc sp. TCL26-01]
MTNNCQISLLELIDIFTEYRNYIIINIQHLQESYQRTGVKRIAGWRDEKGEINQPWLRTEYVDNAQYIRMGTFVFNRNTATLNMLIQRQVKLVKLEDQTPVLEVAGLLVNQLNSFNNYTIVSDGKLNVNALKVKISNKKLFSLLKLKNILNDEKFDFCQEYTIRLDNLPIVPSEVNYPSLDGLFSELAEIKVLSSIISAYLKGESDVFVPNQLAELKNNYLSKSVYVNFPTTNKYSDRQQAIANSTLESKFSYKIDIGSPEILNLSKFYSANKFLDKMYRVYDAETGEIFTKPSLAIAFQKNLAFRHKLQSNRIKITKVDEFMQAIFDDFLGLASNGIVQQILGKVGADNLVQILQDKNSGKNIDKDNMVAALTDAKAKLEDCAEKIYQTKVSPWVFYIGVTGRLPNAITAPAMMAEELAAQYPNLQFSKHEQSGTFFVVGNSLISVYPQLEYYSKQVAVA